MEAEALTGFADPLQAAEAALELTDMVLITAGAEGLYLCGYTDEAGKRETSNPIKSGTIADYNQFEFSRPVQRQHCKTTGESIFHILTLIWVGLNGSKIPMVPVMVP